MSLPGFGAVADDVRRWTVQILATDESSSGSGIIIGPNSVMTNAHVAQQWTARVRLWSGDVLRATVERRDTRHDLALLRVSGLNHATPVLRDSSTVRPGEIAIAVGNPMGFIGALSTGVVRGVGPLAGLGRRNWIQADVRLAPGNSGGPLADGQGRVIGINTMIYHRLGLAVPANTVQTFLSSKAPFRLGVTIRPVKLHSGTRGLMVLELESGGAAERAALLPGDILTGLNETVVQDADDLADALQNAGDTVTVRFLRGGQDRVRQTVARSLAFAETAA